jgi:nicotinamidase-related amidase
MTNAALLIIDMQKDYFPEGRFVLPGIEDAAKKTAELLLRFRESRKPIFHVRHIELSGDATFFIPDSEGIEIYPELAPGPGERVITKHYPNSFRGTELFKELMAAGIHTLVICGAMSNMCIDATVRAASDAGFDCLVAHDACAASEIVFGDKAVAAEDVHAGFMGALAAGYAGVMTGAECLKTLEAE